MTIVRVGATEKYSTGWESAFGKGKKKSAAAPAAPKKAAAKRKSSAAKAKKSKSR